MGITLQKLGHNPPFEWAFYILGLLGIACGLAGFYGERMRSRRLTRDEFAPRSLAQHVIEMTFLLMTVWLWLTFLTLCLLRLLHVSARFELLACLYVFGSTPLLLALLIRPLRNVNRPFYRSWQLFVFAMLCCTTAAIGIGLATIYRLIWWQTLFALLPALLCYWGVALKDAGCLPDTFRAAVPWRCIQGERVVLYYSQGKSIAEVMEVLRGCDSTLEQVTSLLEVDPLPFKVDVFLFSDSAVYTRLSGMSGKAAGSAHTDCICLLDADWHDLCSTVAHELAHVMRRQFISKARIGLLEEGLACFVEAETQSYATVPPGITLPMSLYVLAYPDVFDDWQWTEQPEYQWAEKYAHAHSFVRFLIQTYGMQAFKRLYAEAGSRPERGAAERLAQAIHTVYGISLKEMEETWRRNCCIVEVGLKWVWRWFTQPAQETVTKASYWANLLGSPSVSMEHLLLSVLNDETNVACRLLRQANVDMEGMRGILENQTVQNKAVGISAEGWMPVARCAVDFAVLEAILQSCRYVGTEHLLLGVLREKEGLVGDLLADFGIELQNFRQLSANFYTSQTDSPSPPPSLQITMPL